jgi:lipopolysaccharide assembly outer membrane protein LptD (OstA)
MTLRRLIVIVVVVLGGGGAALLAWVAYWSVEQAAQRTRAAQRQPPPTPQVAVILSEQTVEASQGGKPVWSLKFSRIELQPGGRLVTAKGLRDGVIYDQRTGKPSVHITADMARYNTVTRDFELEGNVRVSDDKGFVLTVAKAHYIEAERKIACSGGVLARSPDITVRTDVAHFWPQEDRVAAPETVDVRTPGGSSFTGRDLVLDLQTGDFTMRSLSGELNVQEARRRARG